MERVDSVYGVLKGKKIKIKVASNKRLITVSYLVHVLSIKQ